MVSAQGITEEIVRAVANDMGVNQMKLEPLYQSIDPDALAALYANSPPRTTPPRVSFEYHGYTVVVKSPDNVELKPEASNA